MIQSWDKMYSMFKCPKIQFKMPQFLNCLVYLNRRYTCVLKHTDI